MITYDYWIQKKPDIQINEIFEGKKKSAEKIHKSNVDEINIRIRDDVRMLISETNLWDGPYKKLSPGTSVGKTSSEKKTDFIKILEENVTWKMADDTTVAFSKVHIQPAEIL